VDHSLRSEGGFGIGGWAAVTPAFGPVRRIVAFVDGKVVYEGPPDQQRADIAKAESVSPIDLGFVFALPEEPPGDAGRAPEVYALADGVATKLAWYCGEDAEQALGC
jgi:hypothetical protein